MRSKIYLLQNYVAITIPAITTTTSHDCCHFLIKISLLIPITHSASRQKRSTSYKKHPRQNKAISRVYNKGKSQISLFYTHSIHELGDAGRDAVIALAPVDGRATRLEGLPHLGPRLLSFVRMTAAAAFPRRSPAHARVHYCWWVRPTTTLCCCCWRTAAGDRNSASTATVALCSSGEIMPRTSDKYLVGTQ